MATRKFCRECGYHWFWHLNDGRYKCRQCGHRQNYSSVWESSRLPDAGKRRLLEYFVLGVPAGRLRFQGPASLEATARFYQLIRGVLAQIEGCSHPLEVVLGGHITQNELQNGARHRKNEVPALVFCIRSEDRRINLIPVDEARRLELYAQMSATRSYGQLLRTENGDVYGSLIVRRKKVIVHIDQADTQTRDAVDDIDAYWSYARNWLFSRRAISEKFAHLYLAETLFRFNHREQDLYPLIYKALRETDCLQTMPIEVRIDAVK